MTKQRISDLPKYKFTVYDVVDSEFNQVHRTVLKDILEWIKENATKEGLTVEVKGDKMIFTKQ